MKKFNSETERNEFKDLCTEVLPAIGSIEHLLKKAGVEEGVSIRVGGDGYLSLDIYNSKWRMARYEKNGPVRITYEHSEELDVSGCTKEKVSFGRITENIMEITLVFAEMQQSHEELYEIENIDWKQQFVEWANEFEENWSEDDLADYPEEISKFARKKIAEYAGLEVA